MKTRFPILYTLLAGSLLASGLVSCERVDYPDRYHVTDGQPVVYSVRYADRDIDITQAYMDEVVCLLGDNLTSIVELWFNDQKASLNTSFITKNTLLTSVPKNMPVNQTDNIYMITKAKDTVKFGFKVLPPTPRVISMSNEWAAAGEMVTIYGDFLIDDAATPLVVSFAGADVPHGDLVFDGTSAVSFPVPAGAQPGNVTVTSLSGTGKSRFVYKDDRNILFDWDGSHGGFASGHGWRGGMIHAPGTDAWPALDGNYLYFGGAELGGGIGETWAEDQFCMNYWPEGNAAYPALSDLPEFAGYLETYGITGLALKFEVLVPSSSPWSSCALQIMLTGNDQVTYGTATNSYYGDAALPRAVWMPWVAAGSYDTADKWVTVTFPLTSFNLTNENKECGTSFTKNFLTGLTLFVWHGGVAGTTCNPQFAIDNIRIVPVQ